MEGQQRANAAQLAARNIRQAKGRQRKTPLKSNGPVQQSMQFGGAGGIFGGGAPPTSSFDFSAPGGLSFPRRPSPTETPLPSHLQKSQRTKTREQTQLEKSFGGVTGPSRLTMGLYSSTRRMHLAESKIPIQ